MRRRRPLDTTPLDLTRFHGQAQYLTVYEVTRHYGGPEEGGWWYNHSRPVFTTVSRVPARKLNEVRQRMFNRFGHLQQGDISSVLGGTEIYIAAERTPHLSATRRHPTYC